MAKQTTEEELNLRRHARRRLIGAVALVLLAVFLLPVVFDSDPAQTSGNDIELRIPNKDNAGEFEPKIDLPELDKMAAEVAAASTVAVAQPAPVMAPVVKETPAKSAPETAAKAEPKPKVETRPTVESKPKVESKPAAKQQPLPKTGWVVQVGAFANAETAKNLRDKLSKQGYRAYTEKAGDVMRVRVGSFPTLDAAEKTKAKLEVQGMPSNVVNLE